MKASEVLENVAVILGREDLITFLSEEITDDTVKSERDKNSLITALNFVLTELASDKLRLVKEQSFITDDGTIKLSDFENKILKIISITNRGQKILCELLPQSLKVLSKGEIKVKYFYLPDKIGFDDVIPDELSDLQLLTYGTCAEFYLEEGSVEEALLWRNKFETLLKTRIPISSKYIKERRFV
ncbi:MAG TPA: hypothetical protein DDY82_01795 [Clostridiales bacterium]|nr:hypothetical protein [Clostridiales bacterium]HBJ97788.1 hypothetical protein [Clostridiales bacterium]